MLIFYNDVIDHKRKLVEFDLGKEWDQERFLSLVNYIKFLSLPDFNRNNLRDYCTNIKQKDLPEQTEEDIKPSKLQNLCIFQFLNNQTANEVK